MMDLNAEKCSNQPEEGVSLGRDRNRQGERERELVGKLNYEIQCD